MNLPDIDVIWTDVPNPRTPMGPHGIDVTIVGAAVANAVFDATGTRAHDLPIAPDQRF